MVGSGPDHLASLPASYGAWRRARRSYLETAAEGAGWGHSAPSTHGVAPVRRGLLLLPQQSDAGSLTGSPQEMAAGAARRPCPAGVPGAAVAASPRRSAASRARSLVSEWAVNDLQSAAALPRSGAAMVRLGCAQAVNGRLGHLQPAVSARERRYRGGCPR
jgi:hypothetical protein